MVCKLYCSECLRNYTNRTKVYQGYHINIDMKCEVMPNPSFKKSMTKLCWKHDEKAAVWCHDDYPWCKPCHLSRASLQPQKVFFAIPLSTEYLKSHQISFLLSLLFAALRKVAHKRMDKNWAAWWSHVPEINISN